MKKLLLFLLALALVFSFASCGEKEHVDNDNDGKCDECGETLNENPPACTKHADENSDGKCDTCGTAVEVEENEAQGTPLVLIEDGIANFKIVYSSSFGSSMRKAINNFIDDMEDEDIEIVAEPDDDSELADVEVLIGSVTGRGEEYEIDMHTLGEKGYIVKKTGTKIIVLGGSDKALEDAFEAFIEDYIGYKKNKTPKNLTVTSENDIIKPQTDYRITSVSVNGVDLKGYNIVVQGPDAANAFASAYKTAAEELQAFLYSKAGYWLPIENEVGEKSIVIANVEDAGEAGFRVLVRENVLYIECAYNNAFENSYNDFAAGLSIKQGDINFDADYSFTKEVSTVTYKEFGAKGNGEDNDFYAIKAAHDYANEGGQKVVADRGTYLITKTEGKRITIKTDTDWTNAKFIFDDRNITDDDPERGACIFQIVSDYAYTTYTPSSAGKPGQAIKDLNASAAANGGLVFAGGDVPTIDLGLGYPVMITIYNENHYQYIRYGGNANNGGAQHENVIVDENGVVSSDTSILHDFTEITKLIVRRIDDKPVTITGGEFITRANQCKATYAYFSRNIGITRPNTTIIGIKHYITDEGDDGNPYSGWLNISDTANILIKDCILTGHRVYMGPGSVSPTPQGTYDTGAGNACNITWQNVKQSNFYHLDKNGNSTGILSTVTGPAGYSCWGIMGSNYCKNLTYDNCTLTRLDAHCGTLNASIINDSHVAVVAMIGGGLLTITDSTIYDTFEAPINFRDDYGSTWFGDVYMKNVTFKVTKPNSTVKNGVVSLMMATYTNHDFGYKTYLPQDVYVENFVVDATVPVTTIKILTGTASSNDDLNNPTMGIGNAVNKNPMEPIKSITIKNNKAGYNYIHPMENSSAFADTVLTTIPDEED